MNIILCSEMSVNIQVLDSQKQVLEKDIDIVIDKDITAIPDLPEISELAIRSQSYPAGTYWEDFFLVGLVGATLEAGFNQFVSLNSVKDIQFFILLGATVALLGRRLAVKLFEQFGGHGDSEQVLRVPQEVVEEFVKNNSTELQRIGDL